MHRRLGLRNLRMVPSLVPFVLLPFLSACAESEPLDVLGQGNDVQAPPPTIEDPCKAELAGMCGLACGSDDDCANGQHCRDDGTCGADCTITGKQCDGTCTSAGRCDGTPRPIGSKHEDGLVMDNDPPPEPVDPNEKCIEVVSGFQKIIPTVLLVVDRSGSMDADFDMGRNRWDTVRDTLTDPTTGLIQKLQADVRFGLSLYTSVNPGNDATVFEVCPMLVESPIGLNNFDALAMTFNSTELIPSENGNNYVGHTPTGESLQAATATLLAFAEEGPKAIVLATDGDPDNCMDGDANGEPESLALSENAVQAAFDQGIRTYVISVGNDTTESHLKALAELGQGDPMAQPYSALTTEDLEMAFNDILGAERSCEYPLEGETIPDFHAKKGSVTLGAQELLYDDPNGWTLVTDPETEAQSVVLQGSACDLAKGSNDDVNISFPCLLESQFPK